MGENTLSGYFPCHEGEIILELFKRAEENLNDRYDYPGGMPGRKDDNRDTASEATSPSGNLDRHTHAGFSKAHPR
jgi:hypothetical protein